LYLRLYENYVKYSNLALLWECGLIGIYYSKVCPTPLALALLSESWGGNVCEGDYTKRYRHYYYH